MAAVIVDLSLYCSKYWDIVKQCIIQIICLGFFRLISWEITVNTIFLGDHGQDHFLHKWQNHQLSRPLITVLGKQQTKEGQKAKGRGRGLEWHRGRVKGYFVVPIVCVYNRLDIVYLNFTVT